LSLSSLTISRIWVLSCFSYFGMNQIESDNKKLRPFSCSLCWQLFDRDSLVEKFRDMTVEIEAALSQIPYEKIEVSEEVREQVLLNALI